MNTKNGWDSIKFGINWKALAPYAHCKEALEVKKYYLGVIMPGIILGVLPALLSIVTGSAFLWIYGFIFTIAAGGDVIYLILLIKMDNNELVQDHPEKIGFKIFEQNEKL